MPIRKISPKHPDPQSAKQKSANEISNIAATGARTRIRRLASSPPSETSHSGEGDADTVHVSTAAKLAIPTPGADDVTANTPARDNNRRQAANWNEDGSYKVGRGKPSPNHYFPKGKSGNPKGRPKGKRSINAQARAIFDVKVPVKVNGETKMLDATGVMLTKLYELAAKGKLPAIAQVLAIQRDRYPEPSSTSSDPLSSDELSLIDTILTEAGFAASPVLRAGLGGQIPDTSSEDEK